MDFEIISDITEIEIIAVGRAIRELPELQKRFGRGRWRKLKGVATVRLFDGIGKKRMKIKRYLD